MVLRIQQRLTLIFSIIFAIVFFGIYLYLETALSHEAYLRIRNNLQQKLALCRLYVREIPAKNALSLNEWDSIADRVGRTLGLRTTVVAIDGTVLGDSDLAVAQIQSAENHLHRPEIQQALIKGYGEERRYSLTLKKEMLYMAVPLTRGGAKIIIRLAIPLSELEHVSRHLQLLLIISLILAFGISVFLSFIASGYFSRPLKEMSQVAKRIAAGEYSQRIFFANKDEITDLANSMNYMSEQIRMKIEDVAKEKSRLEAVLLSMFEGVLVTDPQGRILLMNEPFKKIFHVSEEPAGKNTLEIIRNIKVEEVIGKVLKKPEGVESVEISVFLPEEKIISVHAAPILRSTQLEGVVVVFHDITELRRMEQVRREFVANVSHELRTPLASIQGYAETLMDGAIQDKENAEDFLKIIHLDAERLARLIEDLLDLSRIESGALKLELKPISLRQVAARVIEGLQRQIEEKSLTVRNEIPDDLAPVQADEDRIAQVFLNLIDNAVKYTSPGGSIFVSASKEANSFKVEVSDTGIGIPEEDIPRLFERFYRVDKARSRELGGTGLGLSIVKHIVLAHNGQVSVKSELGRGSTFSFTLSLA